MATPFSGPGLSARETEHPIPDRRGSEIRDVRQVRIHQIIPQVPGAISNGLAWSNKDPVFALAANHNRGTR